MGELVEIVANTPKFNFMKFTKNRHEIYTGQLFWPIRHILYPLRLFNVKRGSEYYFDGVQLNSKTRTF